MMLLPLKQSSRSATSGVTLIELIVAVAIMSAIGLAVTAFQKNIFKTSKTLQTELTSESQIRKVFRDFTAEVRSALPAWNGAYIIDTAGTSTIIFYATLDKDKYTERIRYQLTGTTLQKGVKKFNLATGAYDLAETVTTIATNVKIATSSALFTYYDKTYDGTSGYPALALPVDIARVRLVRLDLPLQQMNGILTGVKTYSVQATFRNLKDNY